MEGGIIPLRVYFYLRLQARFNYSRVLTSVSILIYCLTADVVTSSCSQILVSSPLLAKTYRLLHSMYRVRRIQKNRKYPSPSACISKLYLQLVCQFVKWPLRTVFSFQIEAIRRGLLKVLSQAVLDLLTWQELERRVCGDPELTVEALKKCSKYNNN